MKKNSNQVLKEMRLDQTIAKFEHKEELAQAIDDLINFRVVELDSLIKIERLTRGNVILTYYINNIIIEHAKRICTMMGVTVEGFKIEIEQLEKQKEAYDKIRNRTIEQVDSKPKETM